MNNWNRIKKTRKPHKCAVTSKVIPVGSACWKYVGVYEGEFQGWYCTDEAKQFIDKIPTNGEGFDCEIVGEMMREAAR